MGVPEHFSIYWCEQASSAAQVCKEINEAKRSAIYLQNEQGMDDAQRAEKRRLGGKSRFSDDGLKLRRNKNRCWFPDLGFQSGVFRAGFSEREMVSQSKNGIPKYGFSIKKWYPKIWFLNQKMVSQNMVSQSKNSIPKYYFSIKIW